jgi:hypothetical protein
MNGQNDTDTGPEWKLGCSSAVECGWRLGPIDPGLPGAPPLGSMKQGTGIGRCQECAHDPQ